MIALSGFVIALACSAAGFPDADWQAVETPAAAGAKAAMEAHAFTLTGEDIERLGVRTDSLLILHRGQLIYERYGRGFGPENPHLLWSVTKSIMGTLVGRAVHEGLINLDESICTYDDEVPEALCAIRVLDLLQFTSGIDFKESYEGERNQVSSVLAMLYGVGSDDMAQFVTEHPVRDAPGETFSYSTGDAVLLARVLGKAVSSTFGADFPWAMLFDRLGITSATIEQDKAGTYVGGSYGYMTPRDLLRFGYFLRRGGCWKGEQLLATDWVDKATVPNPAMTKRALCCADHDVNGRSFWLNRAVPETDRVQRWPDAPEDTFAGAGHWGQYLWVIPSKDLVVVRFGDDRDKTHDSNELLRLVIEWTDQLP